MPRGVPYRAGTGSIRSPDDSEEVTVAMETTTTYMKATTHSEATSMTAAFGVGTRTSAARRFRGSVSLLPVQPLSITGYVRPATAITFADEHDVRTWSPPV